MDYSQIEAMSAVDFLCPEKFVTSFDGRNPARATEQYQYGKGMADKYAEIHISVRGVWSARGKDGSSLSSYEGIGYHAHTAALLRGFLDSGCLVIVHRYHNGALTSERIK